MSYDAGEAFLQIVPSFRGVAEAIEAEASKWAITGGRRFSRDFNDEVRRRTNNAPLGPSDTDSAKQGQASAGKFADGFRARLTAALRALPPVTIGVAATEAEQKLRDLRVELEALSRQRVGIDIDEATAIAQIDRLKAELDRLATESPSIQVRADTAAASAELARLRAEIDETANRAPEVRVRADITEAAAKIAEVHRQMEELSGQRIGVDIDHAAATAQLDRLKAELDDLAARSPSVSVRMDTAAAKADLDRLRAQVDEVAGKTVDIQVRADTAAADAKLAALGASSPNVNVNVVTGPALASIAVIKTALLGLAAGAIITPLIGGAAALLGPLTAAGAGVGALGASALPGLLLVKDAYTAQGAAAKTAGANATAAAAAQKQAAEQVKAAELSLADTQRRVANDQITSQESIARAQQGVADARRQQAQDAVSSQQAIQAAQQGVAQAEQQAAQQQAAAAAQVTTAEQALASAQQASLVAQQALTAARDAATRSLQDQAFAAKDAALQVTADQLAVRSAQQNLDAVNSNSKSTDLQRQQAALALAQAQQRLTEQQVTLRRATEDNNKAQRAGVAGSSQVVAANNSIATAQQQQATAAKAVTAAQANQVQVQQTSAASIARAQQGVANADRAQAQQRLTDSERVATAEMSLSDARRAQTQQQASDASAVTRAQMAVAQAQDAVAKATSGNSKASGQLAAALAALSPQERAVLDSANRFKTAFTGWGKALEPQVLPLFTRGLGILAGLLPKLTPLVSATAAALGKVETTIGRAAASPGFTRFIATLTSMVGPALAGIATIAGNVGRAVAGVITGLGPLSGVVLRGLGSLTANLAKAASSPAVAKFVQTLVGLAPVITSALGGVGALVGHLLTALAPLSGPVIGLVGQLASALGKIVVAVGPSLSVLFRALGSALGSVVKALAPAIVPVIEAIASALTRLAPTLALIAPPLAAAFVALIPVIGPLADLLNAVVLALIPVLPLIAQLVVRYLPPFINLLTRLVTRFAPFAPQILAVVGAGYLLLPMLLALPTPLVLIIGAVALLVGGFVLLFRHSKTFHDFVMDKLIPGMRSLWSYLKTVVYPILKKIAEDALAGLRDAFKIVSKAVSDNRDQLRQLVRGFLNVVNFIVTRVLPILGPILKAAFTGVGAYIGDTIGIIGLLVKAFGRIVSGAKSAARGFASAFGSIKTAAQGIWRDVETIFTNGVNFVTQNIINPLIDVLDKVLGPFGVHINHIPRAAGPTAKSAPDTYTGSKVDVQRMPGGRAAYATGGTLPGFTPGRDVHRFVSPTAGVLDLSGGEGILRPEVVQALGGAPAIHALNAPYNGGRAGSGQAFFGGGVFQSIADKIRGGAAAVANKALRVAESPIEGLLAHVHPDILHTITSGALDKLNAAVYAFIRGTAANQPTTTTTNGPGTGSSLVHAKTIIQQAKQMGLGTKGAEIGLMTSLVETNLKNYANSKIADSLRLPHDAVGSDGYSAGIMQQQTGPFGNYWGTVAQVMNPAYAAHRFFDELLRKVPGYASTDPGVAAQTVQVSAFPDRYSARRGDADNLIRQVGYDSGGYLPPGITTVYNGTGAPEPVLTPAQLNAVAAGSTTGSQAGLGDLTVFAQFGEETIEARTVRVVDAALTDVSTMHRRM